MNRRTFMLAAGALLTSGGRLAAEHHVISANPLIVESEVWPPAGIYTTLEDFYVRNHFQAPAPSATGSLTVEGEVDKPTQFTLESFSGMAERELGAVLECAGGPLSPLTLASDGLWRGWPLAEILGRTQPRTSGTWLHLLGRDGFSRGVPIDRALKDGLLATSLNGRPLAPNHGAPWRAFFPGWYGMDSVKWLEKIVVAATPLPALDRTYLQITRQANGELDAQFLPKIQVKSIITSPADGAVLQHDKIEVRGVAWSGAGRISTVQVTADQGVSWRTASVESPGHDYDWILWRATISLDRPGAVNLISRATDTAGNTQPASRDPRRADGYAYNVCHRIRCVVL